MGYGATTRLFHDVKSASTPTDLEKPLVKDADADDVDEHLYKSMIRSLMYLTASRPDIMFVVCACARFQVSPKTSHLLAVKRIFRYLKGKPSLGLWYSKDSPLELVSYTDSDYAGAILDRKSTIGGCQFLGNRSAKASNDENGEVKINATIDGHSLSITEGSLRRHLKLADQDGQEVGLFPNMLAVTTPSTSPSRITSSPSPTPSPSPEPTPAHSPSPTQPSPTQPSPTQPSPTQPSPTQPSPTQLSPTQPGTEHHPPTPHDSPLHAVHSHGSDEGSLKLQELMNLVTTLSDRIGALEADLMKTKKTYSSAYTKLILRVKKLESQIKIGKARRQARVVLSDDEAFKDDSSKQGRKLSDEEVQEKASTDTELFIQEVTPTEVIQDQEGSEKASDEVSTAGAKKDTASEEVPRVSTAEVNLSTAGGTVTYTRRSAEKRSRQDKGKAIMIEEEPKKKSKKDLEQERLSYAEAIRLEEQMNEEQRAQIARDEEIARQWDEEERKRAMDEAKTTKKIDWNDPSVIRYHTQKMKPKTVAQARRNMIKYLKNQGNYKISDFKGMSYNDIRPIFEKVWDFNQNIEPMDAEHGSEKQESPAKEKSPEKVVEEEIDTQEELKEGVKEPGAKRKKSIPRKSTRKRQKLEEDAEKDELKGFLDIVPREKAPIEVEFISTKFPIVDWKKCVLTETFMYNQVFRGDGSSKNYKILSEMLEDFDRLDVEELFILVKERYSTSRPEGFDLMLWGDLHTLFEPDEDDKIWRDQHEYNLLSWRLCDFYGIHILLMENGLAIHMLTEKKYHLSQEMLTKMLCRKLENSNSYLRDILGDILGKDMYYPLTFVKPIRVSLVYKRNPKAQCYVRWFLRSIDLNNICEDFMEWMMQREMEASELGLVVMLIQRNAKVVFKQQFKQFNKSNSEGLEKGDDRWQQSLPPAWSNLAMTMRTNPEIDNLSIDDLYNNLRVFEQEIQVSSKHHSILALFYISLQPNILEKEVLAGFADEVIYSLFAKQSEDWDLLHVDLEQIDDVDIEEMDINWQIAMIAIRMKKFYKKTGRRVHVDGKTPVGFDKKKLGCFNCHNMVTLLGDMYSKGGT
ncbi:hypothetical protein Tco_0190797 [Tanacetum coccineum]